MNIDNFRYDASELMARPVGANDLWVFFINYLDQGEGQLVKLLNNLDKNF